jgi:DNA repair exonuclease SbcCD ATPase subunit
MNDNSGTILTGLFVHGESQRKAQDAQHEQQKNKALQKENSDLQDTNNRTANLNDELEDEVALLQRHQQYLLEEFAKEREYRNMVVDKHNDLLDENAALKEENEKYKKMLCKPMAEIAAENNSFKETYEKQMELMTNWMVSQKAFKELAIQFGFEKGLTAEEVIEMGHEKRIDVLENQNNPSHKTNAEDIPAVANRVIKLKEQIKNK